jgi:SH3-like domain-containing protein
VLEVAYVSAPQVNLRDRVSALYNKTGTLKNGERVDVLERNKRFVRVRNASGETGWVEQRYLVGEDIYRQLQQLAAENRNAPTQATAVARASLKIHVSPGRDTESLIQLKEGEKVQVLKRSPVEKPQTLARPTSEKSPALSKPGRKGAAEKKKEEEPAVPMEDWSLVRDAECHSGWVLARMLDIDVPLDVAQYAEGQRIVAFFVLNKVHDYEAPPANDTSTSQGDSGQKVARGPRDVSQYLVLLTEPKDGLPWDFNQARVFTWNLKRHRYETAYRERNLSGVFPVTTSTADFGKEGAEPVFTLPVKEGDGSIREKKYRLIGPIVRRVMTPQEEVTERAARVARKRR